MLKGLKILKIKDLFPDRVKRLESAPAVLPAGTDGARRIARALHPTAQYLKVAEVKDLPDNAKSFTLVPDPDRGTTELAWFAAGKYLTVFADIDGMPVTRAYSISSSPREALEGRYVLTIKLVEGGLVSKYIFENWKEGTEVTVSAPDGHFDYEPLRDAKKVVALAGGSGITPFLSMAKAIADGDEDFDLTLLYGSRNKQSILFKKELDDIAKACDKFRVIHVLSDPDAKGGKGFEKGFITAELIKKYAPEGERYSVFLCGPQAMYEFLDKELAKLELPRRNIRHEMFGEFHNPKTRADYPKDVPEEVTIRVTVQDKTWTVRGSTNDSVMQVLEKSGIAVPARCRSGECGFCHSTLVSGEIWVPEELDFRRLADYKFGGFHPCCSFPLGDLEILVPVARR